MHTPVCIQGHAAAELAHQKLFLEWSSLHRRLQQDDQSRMTQVAMPVLKVPLFPTFRASSSIGHWSFAGVSGVHVAMNLADA